jgi:hypothetical protein
MSLFSTVELLSASSGAVRGDNQKPDHDAGLEAAIDNSLQDGLSACDEGAAFLPLAGITT